MQDQIEKIKQTTEKRIGIYQKKEDKLKKDIEFILKENEQLKVQGANLNVYFYYYYFQLTLFENK